MSHQMKIVLKCALFWLCVGLLTACGAFERTDIPGTQIAENIALSTEVVAIHQTAVGEQATHTAQTEALINEAALVNGVNSQLLGTLQAVVTPTVVLIQDNSIEFSSLPESVQGNRLYVGTGVSDSVDGNGCITTQRLSFDPGVQRIYATLVLYNVTVNTNITINWFRNGELVFSDSWVATQDASQMCLWFDIDPSRVQFLSGEWRVIANADGSPAIDAMGFTINGG